MRCAGRPPVRVIAAAGGIVAALAVAACGSSDAGSSSSTSASPSAAANGGGSSSASAAAYTISAANVGGVGTVLVNGAGMTLYILTSEQGGKITCTDATGCTKVWPDTELPSGVTAPVAGAGIQQSLLSTVKSADGSLYTTYAGYPLYTFSHDQAGTANGEGIKSFGGTWETMNPDGSPVSR
ncbi:MAG TPA: hypothetical protein VFO60_02185 [Candidatus Dormibacteraeota bacterium]|nr:hypothetical protein [Candidatus Dormibacteraeota bacterium]